MPAKSPPVESSSATTIAALGRQLRARRKLLHISATDAAEASGISRVTLHRIERGEPSVAMASYVNAVAALGLTLEIVSAHEARARHAHTRDAAALPATIRLADWPQLRRLAWQRDASAQLSPEEALNLYERNWRHIDPSALSASEWALVNALAREWGGGRLLV